jgi:hypothetical protein
MDFFMQKVEIEGKVTKEWIVSLMADGWTTYDIVCNYKLEEDVILESLDFLDKEVIIEGVNLSEDFLIQAIDSEEFTKDDVKKLTMSTYSILSSDFIAEYSDYINWSRMILYISTQSDTFDNYITIIEENNLWDSISANDLPVDFIRQWKEKLNWTYLSMVKEFTDEEKLEFQDFILTPVSQVPEGNLVDSSQFVSKMSQEEVEDLIEQINKLYN